MTDDRTHQSQARNPQFKGIQQHIQAEPESVQIMNLGRTTPTEPTKATTTTTATEAIIQLHQCAAPCIQQCPSTNGLVTH